MAEYRIKELREEKGMSQQQLAELSNVSRSLIAGLESQAIKETSTATLKKLATALEVPVNQIFF